MRYVIGHKKPDSDSVLSAIALSEILKIEKNLDFEPVILGKINRETEFILNATGYGVPKMIDKVNIGDEVFMVDHNEFSQAVEGIEDAKILGLFDHHKISFKTDSAIDICIRPLGSTCAVLYEYSKCHDLDLSLELKKLLLYGMIADTLGFRLKTTTELDKKYVLELAKELNINHEEVDAEIVKAGTNIEGIPLKELLFADYKEFNLDNGSFGIGVITVAELNQVKDNLDKIKKMLQEKQTEKDFKFIGLAICRILEDKTLFVGFGQGLDALAQSFNQTPKDNIFEVDHILSRKKEVVPVLSKLFA